MQSVFWQKMMFISNNRKRTLVVLFFFLINIGFSRNIFNFSTKILTIWHSICVDINPTEQSGILLDLEEKTMNTYHIDKFYYALARRTASKDTFIL